MTITLSGATLKEGWRGSSPPEAHFATAVLFAASIFFPIPD
jgi:hypothetical protein